MPKAIRAQLEGREFGHLRVIEFAGVSKNKHALWLCHCTCGNTAVVFGSNLVKGNSTNCGCIRLAKIIDAATKHGHTSCRGRSREYNSWASMHQRCGNPKHMHYPNYGGRGIKVCDRWKTFANFVTDMGPRPAGKTLDRKNNDGNYEPGNCHWATGEYQARNRRRRVR